MGWLTGLHLTVALTNGLASLHRSGQVPVGLWVSSYRIWVDVRQQDGGIVALWRGQF